MAHTDVHPTMAELRRLSMLRDMDRAALSEIASRLVVVRAKPGAVLLEQGSHDDSALYLLEGRVRLAAADGKVKEFDHQDPSAHDPIARLRPSHYEVTALTPVNYLRIDNSVLDELESLHDSSALMESYEVSEETEFDQMPPDNRLLVKIFQDLDADKLSLPTLPQIGIRISQVMQDPNLDANVMAKVVSADPAIAAKLLRAANSPRFGGKVAVKTLANAIARLGLNTTHQLVISFAVRELFRTGSGTLKQHMRDLWRHSRRVAAISHVLAAKADHDLDPAFALLAGLLHDIGAVAVLGYARDCPELTQEAKQLDEALAKLRSQLGSAIVRRWHLPDELALVAHEAEHWDRDASDTPDYVDVVIIAQLHCFVGSPRMLEVPRINEVPAYRKLGLGEVTPDFSLHLLEEAGAEIREVEELLGD